MNNPVLVVKELNVSVKIGTYGTWHEVSAVRHYDDGRTCITWKDNSLDHYPTEIIEVR